LNGAQEKMQTAGKKSGLPFFLAREPVILALLFGLAVVSFLGVAGLSRLFHAQQDSLGNRWFTRGVADLNAKKFDPAVLEFHTALRYSRDNYSYQLNLAEALIGLGRTSEAYSYLINLWEQEPEDGLVNLALARIAAQTGGTNQALRYYHNAIYATWPGDGEQQRRAARVELIEYLLKINAKAQAQAELMALAANLGDESAEQAHLGDLFLRSQDYQHALSAYQMTLKSDRHDRAALAGAGWAAYETGRYPLAQKYLQAALGADPTDVESAARLKTTELVLQMDPFRMAFTSAHRNRNVVDAFATAGERLRACGGASGSAGPVAAQPSLGDSWAEMKPRVTERNLQRDPDLVQSVMDLVFTIERQTASTCGSPTGPDLALLLIAKLHEGN
jgi:tetratricopeptide (TPR) repeat protein